MPHAGEYHGEPKLVGGRDHLIVAHASAGLDNGLRARSGDHFHAVLKREECVRRDDRPLEGQSRVLRLEHGKAGAGGAAPFGPPPPRPTRPPPRTPRARACRDLAPPPRAPGATPAWLVGLAGGPGRPRRLRP